MTHEEEKKPMTPEEALESIRGYFDAYYFVNKYGNPEDCTHAKEFAILEETVTSDMGKKALNWIRNCYDCWNASETLHPDSPFTFLVGELKRLKEAAPCPS